MFCFSWISYVLGEVTNNVFGIIEYVSEENALLLLNNES